MNAKQRRALRRKRLTMHVRVTFSNGKVFDSRTEPMKFITLRDESTPGRALFRTVHESVSPLFDVPGVPMGDFPTAVVDKVCATLDARKTATLERMRENLLMGVSPLPPLPKPAPAYFVDTNGFIDVHGTRNDGPSPLEPDPVAEPLYIEKLRDNQLFADIQKSSVDDGRWRNEYVSMEQVAEVMESLRDGTFWQKAGATHESTHTQSEQLPLSIKDIERTMAEVITETQAAVDRPWLFIEELEGKKQVFAYEAKPIELMERVTIFEVKRGQ